MGEAGFSKRPFFAGSLIGLRSFGIQPEGPMRPLSSLFHTYYWDAGVNVATCQMRPQLSKRCGGVTAEHTHGPECYFTAGCPGLISKDCDCGFWAYTNGENHFHTYPRSIGKPAGSWGGVARIGQIAGIIEGFGKCVIGPRGFRCEKARIRALILPISVNPRYSTDPEDQMPVVDVKQIEARLAERLLAAYPDVPVFGSEYLACKAYPLSTWDMAILEEESQA